MNRFTSLVVGILALAATACGQTTGESTPSDTTPHPAAGACLEGSLECHDNPLVVDEYGPATVDLVIANGSGGENDGRTQPITDLLGDGIYFSQAYKRNGSTVKFTLSQYFQCDTEVLDEPEIMCASGFGTLDHPNATVDLAADALITIATGDLGNPARADVSVAEFVRLVGGEAAAPSAPDDFVFTPHFVFVEVRDGQAAAVEQFYVS